MDATSFTTCAGGRTHADAYNTAVDKAAGDSVQGTPTIIIGGQKVVGPQPYNIYKALLEVQ
ncbi:thioredoxin domain-containing protein [Candidatus Saccharibacteria bacterium]|nr:MAG: thioredoxin domain-containing protein [Candidatus Saccharibacteria bacterium]